MGIISKPWTSKRRLWSLSPITRNCKNTWRAIARLRQSDELTSAGLCVIRLKGFDKGNFGGNYAYEDYSPPHDLLRDRAGRGRRPRLDNCAAQRFLEIAGGLGRPGDSGLFRVHRSEERRV